MRPVCYRCGSELVGRTGSRGPFLACPRWPDCEGTTVAGMLEGDRVFEDATERDMLDLFDDLLTEISDRDIDLDAEYK